MKMRKLSSLVATLSCTLVLGACTVPFQTPTLKSRPPGSSEFPGIADLAYAAPGRTLDVLIVHGMCTHDQDWAEGTIKRLSSMLSSPTELKIQPIPVEGTNTVLYRSALALPGGIVRVTALVWSPVIAPLKSQLCYDQTNKSKLCKAAGFGKPEFEYPYERALFNRTLKDGLLNDCLADAIIYQGKSRDAISAQLQKAILTAAASSGGSAPRIDLPSAASADTAPLVLITESLGSKIAFDAIYKLVTSPDPSASAAGVRTFDRTTQVFMGANQIPILALADQRLDGTTAPRADRVEYPPDPFAALVELKKARMGRAAATPKVVAFSDPNDLLSYILVPARQAIVNYEVVDVIVSNDNTYFGVFERPDIAHTGYRENSSVMRLIACGTSKSGCNSL